MFKFIDNLKLDENISRAKIVSCEAGHEPPKKKAKDAKHENSIKNAVLSYQKAVAAEAEKQKKAAAELDSDDEQQPQDEDVMEQRQKWLNSPALQLLKAIAHNTTL